LANLIQDKQIASDPEVVVFIYTRIFEAPITREWVDIYTHICCKVLEQYFGEDQWENVDAPRTISDYEKGYYLKPLQEWIYQRRRKVLKERMKAEAKTPEPVVNTVSEAEVIPNIVDGHYALWNS